MLKKNKGAAHAIRPGHTAEDMNRLIEDLRASAAEAENRESAGTEQRKKLEIKIKGHENEDGSGIVICSYLSQQDGKTYGSFEFAECFQKEFVEKAEKLAGFAATTLLMDKEKEDPKNDTKEEAT